MERRRAARILILLALYQLEMGGTTPSLALESVFSPTADEALEGFFLGPKKKKVKNLPKATDIGADPELHKFVESSVVGTWNKRTELDDLIRERTDNWRPERMLRTDLNILRMAVYEMTGKSGVPAAVTINEAVELAKAFGEDESGRFVNGILGAMIELRPSEETPEVVN